MTAAFPSPLPRFVLTYALMYAAFGVASPFWSAFFESRGLAPEQLGILFAAGTAVRLLSGPAAGRLADRLHALRAVLACCTAVAACVALGLLPAQGFWLLLLVSICHAAALAPITTSFICRLSSALCPLSWIASPSARNNGKHLGSANQPQPEKFQCP